MRILLLSVVALVSLLGASRGNVEPASDIDLTPAQIELIQHYLGAQNQEMKPHQDALREITERYDRIIRQSLPPEKHPEYLRMKNGC